jgi:hypothetical protein
MIIRELLITEPDRGSGCAARRALLIWVAALVYTILTSRYQVRRHFFRLQVTLGPVYCTLVTEARRWYRNLLEAWPKSSATCKPGRGELHGNGC